MEYSFGCTHLLVLSWYCRGSGEVSLASTNLRHTHFW